MDAHCAGVWGGWVILYDVDSNLASFQFQGELFIGACSARLRDASCIIASSSDIIEQYASRVISCASLINRKYIVIV